MQLAEEYMARWLQIPRIGIDALPITNVRGGNREVRVRLHERVWSRSTARGALDEFVDRTTCGALR